MNVKLNNQTIGAVNQTRIAGIDIARALAVLGMILVNFKVVLWDWSSGPKWLVNGFSFFEGKAAATFVVLAGVGISLLSQKARATGDVSALKEKRGLLLKRALFLFVGGLLYTPLWPADILHFYGLYIAVAAFLLAAPSRRLWIIAAGAVPVFIILFYLIPYSTGWNFSTLTYLDLWTAEGMVRHMFYNGFHPVFPWIFFLLFGMWLGRRDLTGPKTLKKYLLRGLATLVMVELFSKTAMSWFPFESLGISPLLVGIITGTSPMPPMPLYLVSGTATAVTVICACIHLTKNGPRPWMKPLIHTGQMAFSLYIFHVIIGMGIPEEFGLLNKNSLETVAVYVLLFSALSILIAHYYRKKFKRGPVESFMRKITLT